MGWVVVVVIGVDITYVSDRFDERLEHIRRQFLFHISSHGKSIDSLIPPVTHGCGNEAPGVNPLDSNNTNFKPTHKLAMT